MNGNRSVPSRAERLRASATLHVFYGGIDLMVGSRFVPHLRSLERSQWYSREALLDLQNRKLRALIRHAVDRVPYYERAFHGIGLSAEDIHSVPDLANVPILTRESVQNHFHDLTSDDWRRRHPVVNATSGSTGVPLKYLFDRDCVAMGWACLFRSWEWDGYRMGDRRALIRGTDFASKGTPLHERIRRHVERNLVLSSHAMGPTQALQYARAISEFRPTYVRGHPSALAAVGKAMLSNALALGGVRAVYTTGEQLTARQRMLIEQAFRCPVRDQYGLNDGGALILQCPASDAGLYHIIPERAIVEILRPDGTPASPGEAGEIVSTDLHNYAMPFIRYRTGDLAVMEDQQCSCGREFPTIRRIEGRIISAVKRRDGTRVTGLVLSDAFEQLVLTRQDCVHQYCIVQNADLSIRVLVVAGRGYDDTVTNDIKQTIWSHVGKGIDVGVERVPEIPASRNGKRRYVVSHAA
ncbi:MAG: phenylacetate--CoA ligase family protein [Dehalococcoidia bacterium]|nr:phenylacetate--CoA ligase family protein [Dehalococcoidia bacterium]